MLLHTLATRYRSFGYLRLRRFGQRASIEIHLETDHFVAWWSWVQPHLSGDLVINVASLADFHNLD